MLKRLFIAVFAFGVGIAGNLIAAWIQPDVEALSGSYRLIGAVIGVAVTIIFVTLLESERALSWNWRWHRFWYLLELLNDPRLCAWQTDYASLDLIQRKRKVSDVEVMVDGRRQDLVTALRNSINNSKKENQRILILGEPGSGKTTGLERLTFDLAVFSSWRLGIWQKIPVLVRLGNFQDGSILDYISQSISLNSVRGSGRVLAKGLNQLIEAGKVILLFDALDEALGKRREIVLSELSMLLESRAYENTVIVMTSRTREDPGERIKVLKVFEIQDLSEEAVDVFIRVYNRSGQSDINAKIQLLKHGLLERDSLGRNPFWLRLILTSGSFEGNKGHILNNAIDVLLFREKDIKPVVDRSWQWNLPKQEQLDLSKRGLAWLGYIMSFQNQVYLETDQALQELAKWLTRQVGVGKLRPQDILGLGRDAQILVYMPGPVRFRHRLIQEFMTAYSMNEEEELFVQGLEASHHNQGWWETLFLLGGITEKHDELVITVLYDGMNCQ